MFFTEKGRLNRQESSLCRQFIKQKNNQALTDLLAFAIEHNRSFPIHNSKVRETLFNLSSWKVEGEYQSQIFLFVEEYLFDNVEQSQKNEWHTWLRASRTSAHHVDVMSPTISQALSYAHNSGKLDGLSSEDYDYLLGLYLQSYGEILDKTEPGDQQEMLPVLVEFATIAQILGPSEYSTRTLNNWARHRPLQPRALIGMSNEQVYYAPIRGVGSPHGVSVTIYQDAGSGTPIRISCAGSTGDATLNSQVFTSLFATALACDSEPTFVTSGGATLSLESRSRESVTRPTTNLLSAVIGPGGPVEPRSGAPTLGMSTEEAMTLVSDLFDRFQTSTGVVHVMRWQIEDAIQLENQITQALQVKDGSPFVIKSDDHYSEGAGVIHVIPLLHRNDKGTVEPIEIEIPYHLLGAEKVFNLLRKARQTYMEQLISNGQRRLELARRAYEEQDKQVKHWASLSEEQKEAICQRQPWVTITQSYDFELGLIIPLDPPEKVPRRDYEEYQRPQIRDHAREYAKRFAALCQKLEELNKPEGKADILTFKLLVDSMIRQAPLSIPSRFQVEYRNWVEHSSFLVWAAIEGWARSRGFPPGTLAADNVLFNTTLKVTRRRKSVVIQPWIMVDLHDFAIRIDRQKGVMEVFPSGKTPALADVFISDPENNIIDLSSLHKRFCLWVTNNLLLDDREKQEDAIRSKIFNDSQIRAMITLAKAKQLLFKGDASQAQKIISTIRKFDLAPVYFWGAVAHQYQFLERNQTRFGLKLSQYSQREKAQRLLNAAVATLIEFSKPPEDVRSKSADPYRLTRTATSRRALVPVDKEAKRFLQQLQSRDASFIQGLLEQQPIFELEGKSLNWSEDDQKRFSAAVYALSSLEFLHLAETMKNTASGLPFEGVWTPNLKQDLKRVIEQTRSLTFRDSPITPQIEEMAKRF